MPRKSSDKTYGEKLISLFARREEEKSIIGVLFDIGIEYDVIFSPLFASGDEWEGGIFTQFPVYEEIMKDGAIVA